MMPNKRSLLKLVVICATGNITGMDNPQHAV